MPEPYAKRSGLGLVLGADGVKMSKSRGNVVDPDDVIKKYGADTLRTYIMFMSDYSASAPWKESGVKGCKRFLERVGYRRGHRHDEEARIDNEQDRQEGLAGY